MPRLNRCIDGDRAFGTKDCRLPVSDCQSWQSSSLIEQQLAIDDRKSVSQTRLNLTGQYDAWKSVTPCSS